MDATSARTDSGCREDATDAAGPLKHVRPAALAAALVHRHAGYWKNHPQAWPVSTITVGGYTYTKEQAIAGLGRVGKDKTTTMFSSLVPAMLNVIIGNDPSCVASTITLANAWMATYGPVGSNVPASSCAWTVGEPLHKQMDAYSNGLLCAPH